MNLPIRRGRISRQLQLPVALLDGTEYVGDAEGGRVMVQLLQVAESLVMVMVSVLMVLGAEAHRQLDPIQLGQQPLQVTPVGRVPVPA